MKTTPRVILILKQASSAARLHKTLAQKLATTWWQEFRKKVSAATTQTKQAGVSKTSVFRNNLIYLLSICMGTSRNCSSRKFSVLFWDEWESNFHDRWNLSRKIFYNRDKKQLWFSCLIFLDLLLRYYAVLDLLAQLIANILARNSRSSKFIHDLGKITKTPSTG